MLFYYLNTKKVYNVCVCVFPYGPIIRDVWPPYHSALLSVILKGMINHNI